MILLYITKENLVCVSIITSLRRYIYRRITFAINIIIMSWKSNHIIADGISRITSINVRQDLQAQL